MFPNNLDRDRFPLSTRTWGVFLGTLVMLAVGAALVSPRTIPFSLPILFAGVAYCAYARGCFRDLWPPQRYGFWTVVAFLAYTAISSTWAETPAAALESALVATGFLGVSGLAAYSFLREPRRNIFHISEGLWIGLMAGLAYLLIEILTHQAIKIHLYNAIGVTKATLRPPVYFLWRGDHLVAIAAKDLTRNMAPISLILWGALLAMRGTAPVLLARAAGVVLILLAALVISLSEHETSKLAIVTGAITFAVAWWRPVWSDRMLRVAWVTACLAVVPLSLAAHRLGLHNAAWVQPTAQHRIIIWNHTAEQTLKTPIFGIGAGMMYELYAPTPPDGDDESYSRTAPHAHNVYLQTWFELGLIGAVLLTMIGLAILNWIKQLGPQIAPYAHATYISAMVIAASSYGLWQPWFLAMFGLSIALFAIGVRAVERPGASAAVAERGQDRGSCAGNYPAA